jgi:hypothetical protein
MARSLLFRAFIAGLIMSTSALPSQPYTKPALEVHTIHEQLPLATQPTFGGGDLGKVEDDTTETKTDADLKPSGCFCGGGSMCCYLGADLDCNYGICGLGA